MARILHILPQFPYFGGSTIVGGSANAVYNLACAQVRTDETVTILSHVDGASEPKEVHPGVILSPLAMRAPVSGPYFAAEFGFRVRQWLIRQPKQFDVISVHSGFVDYVLLAPLISRIFSVPIVHTLYCPIPTSGGRHSAMPYASALRWSARQTSAIVAMTRHVLQSCCQFGLHSSTMAQIPCALDLARFQPSRNSDDQNGGLRVRDQFTVLFVGNAKPQKNLEAVLRAVAIARVAVPRLRLIVTTELQASSTASNITRLKDLVRQLDLQPIITWLSIVNDMPRLMQSADVLVAPFLDTRGPSDYFLAALEAMACAKPVICSAVGGMPEVIDQTVGFLVAPTDHTAMAEAIKALAANPLLAHNMGLCARQRCEQLFDPAKVALAYSNLYQEIGVEGI